tara:strand:- start:360 stop:1481 length:1122 start_codon:yes stop_codon:yes gene_type:complete
MTSVNPCSPEIPKARLEIEGMNAYSAPLEGRRKLLRLDFNENTIGPSPKVIEAIRNITSEEIAVYPEYKGLRKAFANNLNASLSLGSIVPNQIAIFNGVDAAIHSIFYAYGDRGKIFLTTTPTFGYYNPCANMQGMKIIEIPYEGRNFNFPLNQISLSLRNLKPKILIICNPNNPTGTSLEARRIIQLAQESPQTLIVIDELYEAFLGDSIIPIVNFDQTPNLIALRSLSKTSGLAGLRIGFAIGHPEVIDRISRVTGPYDINSFAVTAAFAALGDQAYIDTYVAEVLKARSWIKTELSKEKIHHHLNSGNYFLLWPDQNPIAIEEHLKTSGILVRNMKNKHLIDGSLRVSIGTTDQMKLFLDMYKKAAKLLH